MLSESDLAAIEARAGVVHRTEPEAFKARDDTLALIAEVRGLQAYNHWLKKQLKRFQDAAQALDKEISTAMQQVLSSVSSADPAVPHDRAGGEPR